MSGFLAFLESNTGLLALLYTLFVLLTLWQAVNFSELRRLREFYARLVAGTRGGTMVQD